MKNLIKTKIINLSKELIKIPSISENKDVLKKIINFVEKQFNGFDIYIKKFSFNNYPSIIFNLKKEKNPFLFFVGHLDVAPAEKKDFNPKIKNNRIYGQGAGDMKGNIAIMIEVLKYFSKQKNKPSLGLMLTVDEEIGGKNGVNCLLNKKNYQSKLAFIPDAGDHLREIILNQKGCLQLKIKTFGKSEHGSQPWQGVNALDKLIKIYLKIRKIFPEIKKPVWKKTLNLGKIFGGETANKIPDYAEMLIDIRYLKKNEKQIIFKKIKEIVKKENGKIEIIIDHYPINQNSNNLFFKQYSKIIKEEYGGKINFNRTTSNSDASFFAEKNIPIILTTAKCGNGHAENEWVDVKELEKLYEILIKFIVSVESEYLGNEKF